MSSPFFESIPSNSAELKLWFAQHRLWLAPMAAITDCAYREFMKQMGADVLVSELISAKGLIQGGDKTWRLAAITPRQRPVGIQIFGENPNELATAARLVEERVAPDFIDLNLGCPVPKVVRRGEGSALLKDLPKLGQVLRALRTSIQIPLSIKIRTGWTDADRNALEVCQLAYNEGVSWVAIHGRTRAQGYTGDADWQYIQHVAEQSPLPVIGNGDIVRSDQALERLNFGACSAVMIGRGALKNPWIFAEAKSGHAIHRDYLQVLSSLSSILEHYYNEQLFSLQLKKLSVWLATGLPGVTDYRRKVFNLSTLGEVQELAHSFFSQVAPEFQPETTHEGFLMGGHG